jgi:hypothetical protein
VLSLLLAAISSPGFIWVSPARQSATVRSRHWAKAVIGSPSQSATVVGLTWLVDGLQSRPLRCYVGNARVVEAIRHNPDAPCFSVGRHRPDDAKPDLSRPGNRLAQPPQGIVRVTRHPFLTGVGLWALVHLIGNGDVASLVFFAVWAVVALAGTVSIDRKRRRLLSAAWEPFAAQTSIVPFAAIAAGRNRFRPGEIGAWRWGAAVVVYVLMLVGHADVIGVTPFPA